MASKLELAGKASGYKADVNVLMKLYTATNQKKNAFLPEASSEMWTP